MDSRLYGERLDWYKRTLELDFWKRSHFLFHLCPLVSFAEAAAKPFSKRNLVWWACFERLWTMEWLSIWVIKCLEEHRFHGKQSLSSDVYNDRGECQAGMMCFNTMGSPFMALQNLNLCGWQKHTKRGNFLISFLYRYRLVFLENPWYL